MPLTGIVVATRNDHLILFRTYEYNKIHIFKYILITGNPTKNRYSDCNAHRQKSHYIVIIWKTGVQKYSYSV